MKSFIKCLIFLTIFGFLFSICRNTLWLNDTSITYFYEEPKNSLDVVYIGSSNAYVHFNPTLAYNEYGFTTGMLSNDSQSFVAAKYLVKEAEKYQKPSLYIIDLVRITDNLHIIDEGGLRKTIDSMKLSQNRIDLINEALQYSDAKEDKNNFYFSFFNYHNSWKNITINNYTRANYLYKGFYFMRNTSITEPQTKYEWNSDEVPKLAKDNVKVLKELIKYIKDNNLEVLFVVPERVYKDGGIHYNDAIQIIEENNLNIINFANLEDFNVDFSHDLYNASHLNVYGATKYTLYLSKYLKEHYDLKSHLGDELYSSWVEEYNRFKKDFKTITGNSFDKVLNEYKEEI